VNREESLRAMEELANAPAAKWIGNRLDDTRLLQKCTRCGAEQTLELPTGVLQQMRPNVAVVANAFLRQAVPAGFDEQLYEWKKKFQVAHAGCRGISIEGRVRKP
jgi:hypothetical protein